MGYTHYWNRKEDLDRYSFAAAMADCDLVLSKIEKDETSGSKGFYGFFGPEFVEDHPDKDHGAVVTPSQILFNGVETDEEDFSCEDFAVKASSENGFGFCKTRQKPYDYAVCACLIILNHHLGKDFTVSSDGDDDDEGWVKGRAICQDVLGYGLDFTLKDVSVEETQILSQNTAYGGALWSTHKNKAKCLICGDIIESKHVHDFVSCKCGAIAVDGGNQYWKISGNIEAFERIIEEIDEPLKE